ncbi:MAG: mercury methylation ferredoxin HgcB [Eubacteriales bacterium]
MKYLKNVVTLELDEEECTGCRICAEVCPHGVFQLINGKASIQDRDFCMECGACAMNCPFSAISVAAGVGCAYAVIKGKFDKGDVCC